MRLSSFSIFVTLFSVCGIPMYFEFTLVSSKYFSVETIYQLAICLLVFHLLPFYYKSYRTYSNPITMQAADVSHIMLAFYSSICETPNYYAKLSGALCHVPCVNRNNEIINFSGLTQNGYLSQSQSKIVDPQPSNTIIVKYIFVCF